MIRFQLQCKDDHEFDGWFKNSAAYEAQIAQDQLTCPVCGSSDICKALMAPNIGVRANKRDDASGEKSAPDPAMAPERGDNSENPATSIDTAPTSQAGPAAQPASQSSTPPTPAPGSEQKDKIYAIRQEFIAVMRQLRKEVESSADYVGPRFAEEARKIHFEEAEPRGIYGEASQDEIAELDDEGIEFMPLPRLPEDNN